MLGGIGEERRFARGVEVVRADDVQVDDGAQIRLLAPVERLPKQLEGLGLALSLLVPELDLIQRDADVIEAEGADALDVGLAEPGAPLGSAPFRL